MWVIRVHWFFTIALLPLALSLPETYGPKILTLRARRMRRDGIGNSYAVHELESKTTREIVSHHIGRPFGTFPTKKSCDFQILKSHSSYACPRTVNPGRLLVDFFGVQYHLVRGSLFLSPSTYLPGDMLASFSRYFPLCSWTRCISLHLPVIGC